MGESTSFHCRRCDYESGQIRWGVSMLDPRRRFMPAECMHCRTYVQIDLTGADLLVDEFTCPDCGTAVFFVEKQQSYPCPRCGGGEVDLRQGPDYW